MVVSDVPLLEGSAEEATTPKVVSDVPAASGSELVTMGVLVVGAPVAA